MSTKLNVDSIIDGSIHLVKLNEDVTNTITTIAENKAAAAVDPVAKDLDALISDHVIGKGEAENSAVLKGGNNTVTGKYSAAIGYGNTVNNDSSVAFGYNTIAKNVGEHASGIYNVSNSDTQFSIGVGTSDTDRKNAFEVKQNGDIYIEGIGGYDGTNPSTSHDLATYLPNMVEITHEELVNLRKNNRLIPGQQYRITDYETTTSQAGTTSANHPFDIIVTALDESTLSENASAIKSARDTDNYFGTENLEAWQLKYCLDNDTDRFTWADTTNGKGVIYYMKDEYRNECPYDFKNIKFYYDGLGTDVYTFTWIDDSYNVMDTSVFGNNGVLTYYGEIFGVYGNVIKPYIEIIYDEFTDDYLGTKQSLNNIAFISDYARESEGNDGFEGCYNNSFGNDCYYNNFGNFCHSNSFGDGYQNNSFGNDCYYNSFGNNCYYNNFGDFCHNNSFGNYCNNNSFGNECYYNSFGNSYYYNSFGNNCYSNSFGNDCIGNSFGNYCYYNSFGNYCCYNSFGNYCYGNSFGNYCNRNSFRKSASQYDTLLNYCWHNHFDDGCCYNVIWNSVQPTSSNKLQNINVVRGVSGKSSAYNFINIVDKNADYEIKVAKNTNGEIKIYCEADLTKLLSSLDSDGCLTLYHE